MKIAQVAPLFESVPPQRYGGTERVVSFLTEELVRRGHDVTLFASGDSRTAAKLVAGCPQALRLDKQSVDKMAPQLVLLERVFKQADDFDIIHFHCDYLHFPWSRRHICRRLTTLHGRLDIPELAPLYREFPNEPVVSISDSQRRPLYWANWVGTVYHGLPKNLFHFHAKPGEYLAFLGRISPEKRVDRAVRIAETLGMQLKIAAKVDSADRDYYEQKIKPLFKRNRSLVEFIGEIGEQEKDEFLGRAYALLFPIDWPEPFGLVMIESIACGTPVIAYRHGSVPEVLDNGVTGFVVDNMAQAVHAVERIGDLSRLECRRTFERRFSVERMAEDYLSVYRGLAEERCERDGAWNGDTIDARPPLRICVSNGNGKHEIRHDRQPAHAGNGAASAGRHEAARRRANPCVGEAGDQSQPKPSPRLGTRTA
ncbi:MAG TPA: glycosyltransferase family 4 protein [Pirellulales bacterium]|nr:glycosyltransferase family 4 protein [Pirellulales bacterium]